MSLTHTYEHTPNRYKNLTDEEYQRMEEVFHLLRDHGFGFETRSGHSDIGLEMQWHRLDLSPELTVEIADCLVEHGISDFRVSFHIDIGFGLHLNRWRFIKVSLDQSRYQHTQPREPIRRKDDA